MHGRSLRYPLSRNLRCRATTLRLGPQKRNPQVLEFHNGSEIYLSILRSTIGCTQADPSWDISSGEWDSGNSVNFHLITNVCSKKSQMGFEAQWNVKPG